MKNLIFILAIILSALSVNKLNAQLLTTPEGLKTDQRMSLAPDSILVESDKRMKIVASGSDRYGLYIKGNANPTNLSPPSGSEANCVNIDPDEYPGLTEALFGLYVESPPPIPVGGFSIMPWSAFFEGHVGICTGPLSLSTSNSGSDWDFKVDGNNALTIESPASQGNNPVGNAVFRKNPSSNDGFLSLVLSSSNARALEIKNNNTSNLFIKSNGHIESKHSLKIIAGQDQAIEVNEVEGGSNVFQVDKKGAIYSDHSLKIIAGQDEVLEIKSQGGGADVFRVHQDGLVYSNRGLLINSSTPSDPIKYQIDNVTQFKVDYTGKAFAREVEVTLGPIPDYVFESDYDLMPLKDLEVYLKKNKHLPNIPSEKEIRKDGIGLGELSMKELEKIEELTLYLIDLNNKVEGLVKENKDLKEKVEKLMESKN